MNKIIVTIGPSSLDESSLRDLKKAGADTFRINLSHSNKELLDKYINNLIKELYSVEDRPNIRLFYGGSVDENSVEELSSIALLDGFLIGSASADFEKFKNMLNKMR